MFSKLALFGALATAAFAAPAPIARDVLDTAEVHSGGRATYYAVGLGACEWTNTDAESVVAMNHVEWNKASQCGRYVNITNTETGNTAVAQVVDLCPGCASGSLDMSPTLFSKLSNDNLDQGVFPITWNFLSEDHSSE